MTAPVDPAPKRGLAITAHRATLAALAACAVAIALWPAAEAAEAPDRVFTVAAVVLALASIVCRQRAAAPGSTEPSRTWLSLARFAFATGTGVLGCVLVATEGAREVALLYTLGGAILSLRPPATRAGDA